MNMFLAIFMSVWLFEVASIEPNAPSDGRILVQVLPGGVRWR